MHGAGLGVGRHVLRDHEVGRDLDPAGVEQPRALVDHVGLHQRVADARALASRNVNAIAPPMSTVSHRSSSASITPSLSLTLAPPSTATNGRVGVVEQSRDEHLDLAVQQPPARVREDRAAGRRSTRARGATAPNASFT